MFLRSIYAEICHQKLILYNHESGIGNFIYLLQTAFLNHLRSDRRFPLNATPVPTAQQIRLLLVYCGVDFEDAFYEQGDGPEFSLAGRG